MTIRFIATVMCLACALSLVASCVAHAPGENRATLRTFLDEDWKYWMAQYPETATAVRLSRAERPLDRLLGQRRRRAQ